MRMSSLTMPCLTTYGLAIKEAIKITDEVKAKIPTKFPNGIDERIFFQDIDLGQAEIMKLFHIHLNSGAYTRAFEVLNNSEAFFYGSWLLNMFEDRLNIIGNYVSKLEKPKTYLYKNAEPDANELSEGICWID